MTRAVDQEIRDRAINELDRSFAMSAGAGSGKTSVLTDRVVHLLLSGVAPERIAAITFTEKAAGELQARVRDGLETRLLDRGADPVLERALDELPQLHLSTIHAFCQRLLVTEALAARWAPDTEVLPNIVQAEEVLRAYRTWEADFRKRHPVAGLLVRALVKGTTLREGALRALQYRDLAPAVGPFAFDPERACRSLQELAARLDEAAGACTNPDDKLLLGNRPLLALVADALTAEPVEAVVRVLCTTGVKPSRRGGRKGDWAGDGKSAFKAVLDDFDDWRAHQLAALNRVLVEDLYARFLPAVARAKADSAVADFDDLLFRAAALLDDDAVRRRLAERFEAVLVDEVQDTDPIQAEVAALLTRAPDATGPWTAEGPRPGRLFAVGDPRQSIYRFRRADVETWAELRQLIATHGEELHLVQNFRSVPGIVDWVNHTFASLPGYVAQKPFRKPAALEPVVRLPCEPETELDALARYLVHLKETGRVVDRDDLQTLRPVRWSDVMVLLPAWSKAEALQAQLVRAGIPCLVEGGGTFFERDEVRLCVSALRCLEEPGEERDTVFVLRGLFGLDWEALARHRAAGGAWRYTVPDPPPGPVADALRTLRDLARLRGRQPLTALLDGLLEQSGAAAVWAALTDGEARLANLDKLRALVRRVEAASHSPGEAIAALDALAADKEKDLSRVDLDSDAVRITSYFKAKGLEAPVVVVPLAKRNRQGVQAAIDRREREVYLKIGDLRPHDWSTAETREKAAFDAERARWMYVAATRARDQLVFLDHEKNKLVLEHFGPGRDDATAVEPSTLAEPAWSEETFPAHDADVDRWLVAPPPHEPDPTDAWFDARTRAVREAKSASTRWRSVQEIASRERVPRAESPVGTLGGVLVHDVMEALDLSRPADDLTDEVSALVDAYAAELGLDDERAETCRTIVHGMLRHPVLEQARKAPERWKEVPFSYRDRHGRVLSGRIDLTFPTDPSRMQWVVVDWKSDLPARGTPAWRNYQRQLGLYAQAVLKTVTPCERVVETVLVGPHPEIAEPPCPAALVAEVLPELAPGLQALLDRGAPVPRVGGDAGDPIVCTAELAWDEVGLALLVNQDPGDAATLRTQGWTVVAVDPVGLQWAEDALARLAEHLPVAEPDED